MAKLLANIISGIFVLVALAMLFYIPTCNRKLVTSAPKYVIGTIYKRGILRGGSSYNNYFYNFFYKGKEYEGSGLVNKNYSVNFGDRFIIEISAHFPDISYIHYELRVKNDQLNSPDTGWNTMPVAQ